MSQVFFIRRCAFLIILLFQLMENDCFLISSRSRMTELKITKSNSATFMSQQKNYDNIAELKEELSQYLLVRKERKADDNSKSQKGKIIGGTKGNVVLDWVSASPNKPTVVEEEPNIFDYEELYKYGFGHLATPIMNAGGRREMYELMNMNPPPIPERLKPKPVKKITIDRTGETDQGRYKGLKMTQVLNDDDLGRALSDIQKKKKEGKSIRSKLVEEDYEIPFADKRNTGPKWTPDWTAERLDEEGKRQGQAISWARRAKEGQYIQDADEEILVQNESRLYATFSSFLVSIAFGRSSLDFMITLIGIDLDQAQSFLEILKYPALSVGVAAFLSSGISVLLAKEKNRNQFVWAVKGFMGGPVSIMLLRNLDPLQQQLQNKE